MPQSPNKGYELPVTGSLSGTWGATLNTDVFTFIDNNLGGTITKTLSNVDVTLSASEARNGIVRLIGAMSGNVVITTPCLGFFYVENATTGNFLVTMQYTGGVGGTVKPVQGTRSAILSDATNGLRFGSSTLPPGTIIDYAGGITTTLPAFMAGEFMFCDGSAISRTTYSSLFQAIATTWGSGNGTTTFNIPDLRGRATFGRDDMGGSAANRITTAGSGVNGLDCASVGGSQNVTLSAANLPANIPNSAGTTLGGNATVSGGTVGGTGSGSIQSGTGGSFSMPLNPSSVTVSLSSGSASTTVTINASGGTSPTVVLPPLAIVQKLIKL